MRVMTPFGRLQAKDMRMHRFVQLAFEPAFGNGQTPHYGL